MKTQRMSFVFAAICLTVTVAQAQEPEITGFTPPTITPPQEITLPVEPVRPLVADPMTPRFTEKASSSDVRKSKMTTAELRQARALYRSQQRVARLEHNLWMGYEPLRPNWNALPMMSSRYPNRRVYVPVFYYGR